MKAGVEGALSEGELKVGETEFFIDSLEVLEQPDLSATEEYIQGRTLSPVNTTTKREKGGKLVSWDLYPNENKFHENIRNNLIKKYQKLNKKKPEDREFKLKIKEFKPERIKIRDTMHRASTFHFKVKGSPELVETAYNCGLGEKNSMGFGCIEVK